MRQLQPCSGIDAAVVRSTYLSLIFREDWEMGVRPSERRSRLDSLPARPDLAPPGSTFIHAYTPETSLRFGQKLDRSSEEYSCKTSARRGNVGSLREIIPDIRSRCEVTLVGHPHPRTFLRRHRGSTGPEFGRVRLFPGPDHTFSGLFAAEIRVPGLVAGCCC